MLLKLQHQLLVRNVRIKEYQQKCMRMQQLLYAQNLMKLLSLELIQWKLLIHLSHQVWMKGWGLSMLHTKVHLQWVSMLLELILEDQSARDMKLPHLQMLVEWMLWKLLWAVKNTHLHLFLRIQAMQLWTQQ